MLVRRTRAGLTLSIRRLVLKSLQPITMAMAGYRIRIGAVFCSDRTGKPPKVEYLTVTDSRARQAFLPPEAGRQGPGWRGDDRAPGSRRPEKTGMRQPCLGSRTRSSRGGGEAPWIDCPRIRCCRSLQ